MQQGVHNTKDDWEIDIDFGRKISDLRKLMRFTYEQLSKVTGIEHMRLHALERGVAFPGVTRKECEALGKALGYASDRLMKAAAGEI